MSLLGSLVRKVRRSRRVKLTLLLAPPLAFLAIWFYAPFIITGLYSLDMITRAREIVFTPSLKYYERILGWRSGLTIMLRSLYFGALTTAICLLISYPLAYYISFKVKKHKDVLIVLFIIPFWVSFLLRTYAFMTLLDERSFINNILLSLGLIQQPLQLLYTDVAVITVMVYDYMLFMVLPLYANLEKLDKSLLEASSTLGAGPVSTFFRVTLPLSMPGILAGSLLVFIPAVGEFVVPALVGGPNNFMIGNLIYQIFLGARHWWIGSALSILFIAMILVLAIIYLKKVGSVGPSF
ncbi:MAG: ABC transporter permease [Aigarchaeota archaeon]|nr:ABC transporter permease [Candidatus Pelearchaeum maunauluense]